MKIYSDSLTRHDLLSGLPRGVTLWDCDPISSPRIRARGWVVRLRRWGSRRHVNTGQYGAGEQGAATWDDHGEWFAALFEVDPSARIARYDGAENFHEMTAGAYRREVTA